MAGQQWWLLALPLCHAFLDGICFYRGLLSRRSRTQCVVRINENKRKTMSREASNLIACNLVKRDIVADSSNEWPTDAPSWALSGWETPPTSDGSGPPDHGSCQTGNNYNNKFSVTNDSPTWEIVLAKTLPDDGTSNVSPASAMLAPRGGCDNLCDDTQRYSDTCAFTVSGDAAWLLIRTEDQRWIFKPSIM